jgi:hypothetical protein
LLEWVLLLAEIHRTCQFIGRNILYLSDYGLDDRGSIRGRVEDFSSSLCVQTDSEALTASFSVGTGGPFPGGKAWLGRDADHSLPSSAEIKNE